MAEHFIAIEEAEKDLLACAAYVAERIKSLEGHAAAMAEVVPRYLKKDAVDLAAELANTVEDPFARDRLLRDVAEKCAAAGDDEYALQLVEAIEEFTTQDETRELIAAQKAAHGDFAKASEIAAALPHGDYVFADIAVRQFAAGDEAAALATLQRIESPSAETLGWRNLAHFCLEKGDSEKAVNLLERAARSVKEIEFLEEEIDELIDLANDFIEARTNSRAVEIFDRAKTVAETLDNVHRDKFLANIAHGFLRAGSLELADRTLDLVADGTQTATALLAFAREFHARGETTEAFETLEEAHAILKSQRSGEIRDSRARFNLWAAIAVEFARFGKNERALETVQEIPDETNPPAALQQIVRVVAARGETDAARQAVNIFADEGQKLFAFLNISDAKMQANQPDEALNYLREAAMLAENVEQLGVRSTAYNELARRLYDHDDSEKMRELQLENLEMIFSIRDESDRVAALAEMADFYKSKNIELTAAEREMMAKIIGKTNG